MAGREHEFLMLRERLAAAGAGSGSVIAVEGPAGIGKTTLLDAAAAAGRDRGMAVLRARGSPLERDFPFGLARQAFATTPADPCWTQVCQGPAALAGRVLDAGPPNPGHGVEAMHAAAHGLFWLTARYAAVQPVLLCVDDVHWADPPSLRWLAGLARGITELPLALVVAVRSGEPDAESLAELLATAIPLPLHPLDPDAATAMVRAVLPRATPAFTRACHQACGGNPFLLSALLSQLRAERVTPDDEAAAGLSRIGPYRVARWVEHQLRRLPDGAIDLARALAVLGPGATLRQAAELAEIDPARAALLSDAMRTAGLLAPTTAPTLAHPVVATALYDGMGAGVRGLWHARAARQPAPNDPERAALHLLRTEPAGDAFAVDRLREAAAHATTRGAPEIAATFLRRALAEPPGDPATGTAVRLDLALALSAGRQDGPVGLARQVVATIEAADARAEAALRCGRALALTGEREAAVDLYLLALDRPAGVPPATLARIEAELAANASVDSRTREMAETLLARSRAADVPPSLWRANALLQATLAGRPPAECLELVAPLLDTGTLEAERDSLLPSAVGIMLTVNEDLDRTRAMADALIAGALARGWPSSAAHGRFLSAMARLPAGEVDAAVADARASVTFKLDTGTTPPTALIWALHPLVDALVEADRPAEAEAALVASGITEPPAHAVTAPLFLQSRARLRLAQGRHAEALDDLLAAGRCWTELGVRHPGLASWRADAVRAYLALGCPADAVRVAGEHLAAARQTGTPGALGAALRATALVESGPQRIVMLQEAVRVTTGAAARLQHAYALHDLGCALRRANRKAEAREPLLASLEIADAGGAARLAGRARAESHAAGARPRRTARHGMEALTDAERQVVRLATRGLTNRQISERLTLSRRTVETHLAHAYQKLDIHSRAELDSVTRMRG
ncbi:ATP-binding protein [Actinoplanes aureus]|uniref:AAA family ATPase n=1 Tax=Actinoplanes aureus TaxID=2792083 RepID=A0A931FVL7_9ACTN|nr:LuxR family transcriptional regulator [Actinoplanes aureus]MBG0560385.1 AAA family ATPase [Actinoplanes aureus]